MEENLDYMRWLEQMWEVGKLDYYGRTQREEERKRSSGYSRSSSSFPNVAWRFRIFPFGRRLRGSRRGSIYSYSWAFSQAASASPLRFVHAPRGIPTRGRYRILPTGW